MSLGKRWDFKIMNQLSGFLHRREKDGLLIVQRNIWIKFKRDFFKTLYRQPTLNTNYGPPTQAGPRQPELETDKSEGGREVSILNYF